MRGTYEKITLSDFLKRKEKLAVECGSQEQREYAIQKLNSYGVVSQKKDCLITNDGKYLYKYYKYNSKFDCEEKFENQEEYKIYYFFEIDWRN